MITNFDINGSETKAVSEQHASSFGLLTCSFPVHVSLKGIRFFKIATVFQRICSVVDDFWLDFPSAKSDCTSVGFQCHHLCSEMLGIRWMLNF